VSASAVTATPLNIQGADLLDGSLPLSLVEEGQQFGLGLAGRSLQLRHDLPPLVGPIRFRRANSQGRRIGLVGQLDDEAILLVRGAGGNCFEQPWFDFHRRWRGQGNSGGTLGTSARDGGRIRRSRGIENGEADEQQL